MNKEAGCWFAGCWWLQPHCGCHLFTALCSGVACATTKQTVSSNLNLTDFIYDLPPRFKTRKIDFSRNRNMPKSLNLVSSTWGATSLRTISPLPLWRPRTCAVDLSTASQWQSRDPTLAAMTARRPMAGALSEIPQTFITSPRGSSPV
jgi:hypothetical protein